MAAKVEVYIGLGSNLGRPQENLRFALEGLRNIPGLTQVESSSFYRSSPVGVLDQPEFVNAVARGYYEGDAATLLASLLGLEAARGRVREEKWGPRILDLDLLLFGRESIATPELRVPHPFLAQRLFVLVPLAELAPLLVIPGAGKTAEELIRLLPAAERAGQEIERI
ncbi:MAG: 2-amino-4-hydroxy-6-hydroxymethyldihydropteridine diphosphokinase [Deltaproteobacteria bacterium]|nr:2-amino-4-hydroxy-6-hydroxymethyldihydropteridine diphosphokinase [Deltaproteobacteria bacterium]